MSFASRGLLSRSPSAALLALLCLGGCERAFYLAPPPGIVRDESPRVHTLAELELMRSLLRRGMTGQEVLDLIGPSSLDLRGRSWSYYSVDGPDHEGLVLEFEADASGAPTLRRFYIADYVL